MQKNQVSSVLCISDLMGEATLALSPEPRDPYHVADDQFETEASSSCPVACPEDSVVAPDGNLLPHVLHIWEPPMFAVAKEGGPA
ncbi:UNVERIFIED_CONTAM: hypothetical protein K2H54_035540 [Gekko kuhli]